MIIIAQGLPFEFYTYNSNIKQCARFMEFRVVIHESLKLVAISILFRFFFIVHADKGLLVRLYLNKVDPYRVNFYVAPLKITAVKLAKKEKRLTLLHSGWGRFAPTPRKRVYP